MEKADNKKRILPFINSLRFIVFLLGAIGLIIALLLTFLIQKTLSAVEREVMDSRLKADIVCLLDDLSAGGEGIFSLRDGAVYLDGRLLGDGTEENAALDIFLRYEEKTGTFCYLFAKTDNDAGLQWVEDGGYRQGHYIRIAGTTRGPKGERIEGTYIDKKVADALEESSDGILVCEANVNGRPVYCCYQLIRDADGCIIGIISDGRSTEEMNGMIRLHMLRGVLISILLLSAVLGFMLLSVRRVNGNIRKIQNRLHLIGEGKLSEEPLRLHAENELMEIAESVNSMSRSLADREKIRDELSIMRHDLNLAAAIQQNMLTRESFADEKRFSVFAYMNPAKEVGGDFYDYFMIDGSRLAFLIADVSGKGIPAALFMMRSVTALRDFLSRGLPLSEIISTVNNNLTEHNDDQYFVTAWVGILDLETGSLRYVSAGHNPPLLKKHTGAASFIRGSSNLFLGGIPGRNYREGFLQLEPGDTVFLYTDGVTEANNTGGEMFTEERLITVINTAPSVPEKLCQSVQAALEEFCGEAEQFDDITMAAVTYSGLEKK